MMPSTNIAYMVQLRRTKGAARGLDKKCLLMTFPPEPLVRIRNNFTEMFFMMPSTEITQMVLLSQKRDVRALDIEYHQTKSLEPLVQNQNNFTEMVLKLPSIKIDQKVQLGYKHGYQS